MRVRKESKRKRERRMLKLGKGRLGKQRGRPDNGVRVKNGIGRDERSGGGDISRERIILMNGFIF